MGLHLLVNALIAIAGATVVCSILGALWYSSLLFGTMWLSYTNRSRKDIEAESMAGPLMAAIIGHALTMTTLFYLVEHFFIVHSLLEAIRLGLVLGVLTTMSQIPHMAYNKVPVGLYIIDRGYDICCLIIGACVMDLVTG